jgi:hypothetical protein
VFFITLQPLSKQLATIPFLSPSMHGQKAGGLDCYQQPTSPNEISIQRIFPISAIRMFP